MRLGRGQRHLIHRSLLGLCLAALAAPALAAAADPAEPVNLWPVYERRDDRLEGAETRSGLGPVVFSSRSADANVREFGLRPFFFRRDDQAAQRVEWEALYPLMTYRRNEADWEFQLFKLINARGEGSPQAGREERSEFFPFYFRGTTESGQKSFGILPFYGKLYEMLFWDEFDWVAFPFYAHTVGSGVERHYFPWPFLSTTRGLNPEDRISGFRFVPLFGREQKEGEGAYDKSFVLWPLFLRQRTGLDTPDPDEALSVLPFYVRQHSKDLDSTTVLWPFFTYTDDRQAKYRQVTAPWPLVKFAWGERRQTRQVLPFYGDDRKVLYDEFLFKELRFHDRTVLYPLYIRNEQYDLTSAQIRDRILWYLYSDAREEGADGSTRRIDAWPFFWYHRDREGGVRFQTLALLEPFVPDNEYVARNYSPLWSLYTYQRNPAGEFAHSVLWNLVRVEDTRAGHSVEVLGPLFARHAAGDRSAVSLFGGAIRIERAGAVRSLHLFRTALLVWTEAPQAMAGLDLPGGAR
jgi:hypothetical protein